jgi:hypothetical protein
VAEELISGGAETTYPYQAITGRSCGAGTVSLIGSGVSVGLIVEPFPVPCGLQAVDMMINSKKMRDNFLFLIKCSPI